MAGAKILLCRARRHPGLDEKVKAHERLRDDAEQLDLSYSEVLANVLAAHYGFPPVANPRNEDLMKLSA